MFSLWHMIRKTHSVKPLRERLYVGSVVTVMAAVGWAVMATSGVSPVYGADSLVSDTPREVEVVLQRHYLDGEVSEEVIEETIWSMEDFWSYYNDWELVDLNESYIIFRKDLNDISPLMKLHGYFGLGDDGTLSIFNGKPSEDEVIHSFYQVNTEKLKSHLHQSLIEGIPVTTKDDYLDVLRTYKKYAVTPL